MVSHNLPDGDRVRRGGLELGSSFGKSSVGRSENGDAACVDYRIGIADGIEYGWEYGEVPGGGCGGDSPGHVQHSIDGVDQQLRGDDVSLASLWT